MDKEQKALKDFLGDLGGSTEEAELNLDGTTDTTTEDKTDDEPVVPAEEEQLPFHKDPKVQKYIERQLDKKLKNYQPTRQEQFITDVQEDTSLIDAFTGIIGNDTPEKVHALKLLQKSIDNMEARTKKAEEASAVVDEMRKNQQEEQQSIRYLEDSIERIEENYNVDLTSGSSASRKARNDFLDFLGKISPKDEDGEIRDYADPEESFEIFQSLKKPQVNTQAKDIASRGITRSSADSTNTPTKRITFDNVREMMGLDN